MLACKEMGNCNRSVKRSFGIVSPEAITFQVEFNRNSLRREKIGPAALRRCVCQSDLQCWPARLGLRHSRDQNFLFSCKFALNPIHCNARALVRGCPTKSNLLALEIFFMTVTRRTFLRSGSLSALGAALLLRNFKHAFGQKLKSANPAVDFAIPYEAKLEPVFRYNIATFEPYIGGSFNAPGQRRKMEITLVCRRNPSTKTTNKKATTQTRPFASLSLT